MRLLRRRARGGKSRRRREEEEEVREVVGRFGVRVCMCGGFRHNKSEWAVFLFQCVRALLDVIHSLAAYLLTHRHYGNIYSTWRPDSLLENEIDWWVTWSVMPARVCVCVRACGYSMCASVHNSECLHFSMCRAIDTSFLLRVILCHSQWQIFYSAANEIVLCRVGHLYRYDEENKQLVNEIYDMFVYLIFWNCWIHLNNKWDFWSDLSHENSCIPNRLIRENDL